MCGIAGIIDKSHVDKNLLKRMGELIAHRGPDGNGCLVKNNVGLVHHRLSIIDIDGSQQPMSSEDGRYHIVFNGEIYNFRELRSKLKDKGCVFRTQGDTEVLLQLYIQEGQQIVTLLQGMFAFAIWDEREKVLFCARDHYGQKPFFYSLQAGKFVFGSEIKAVLAGCVIRPELNISTLYHYMGLRYCPDATTLFKNIHKIPPASFLVYKNGNITVERYWEIDYTTKFSGSEQTVSEELHDSLKQTIQSHLVSDVKVGTFLSGGVDSSLVTAIASQKVNGSLPTFSVGSDAADFSELPFARQVADKFHTEHHEEIVTPDLIKLIPDLVWHMEEPGDPHGVGIYTLSRFAHKYVKVVLGGDGGDEMFAGYTRCRGQQLSQLYTLAPYWFRKYFMEKAISFIPESFSYYSFATKFRWMNEASFLNAGERLYHSLVYFRFSDMYKNNLFTPHALQQVEDSNTAGKITSFFDAPNAESLIDKVLYTETMTRMPNHYLLIADRLSMAHGLELRVPLIDFKFSEFAAKIPHQMKINLSRQKHILKNVGENYFTKNFLNRTKQGFSYPMGRWFQGSLKNFVSNVFKQSILVRDGIFSPGYVQELNDEHQNGKVDHSFRIWMLINLEVWYRMFFEGMTCDQLREWIEIQTMS